jgi:hypothetical protein
VRQSECVTIQLYIWRVTYSRHCRLTFLIALAFLAAAISSLRECQISDTLIVSKVYNRPSRKRFQPQKISACGIRSAGSLSADTWDRNGEQAPEVHQSSMLASVVPCSQLGYVGCNTTSASAVTLTRIHDLVSGQLAPEPQTFPDFS